MESAHIPTWERRLNAAKAKHRPKLRDWGKDGFADPGRRYHDFTALRSAKDDIHIMQMEDITESVTIQPNKVHKLSATWLTVDDFLVNYEHKGLPCLITDVPETERWEARMLWSTNNRDLFHDTLGDRLFKVGEDDDGYKVKVRMKYFMTYMRENRDDSPLYVFDSTYDDDDVSKCLLSHYKVPRYFPDDLFNLVGEDKRPPYRWFLVGPERSGTTLHVDPLGTSAWNTVIQGRKRWVLFPPEVPKSIAKGLDVILKGEDDESVNYFVDILPRIKEKHGHNFKIIEFTQYPGETIFVPGGWWHAVLNLDNTIAITQNFCSRGNFAEVWKMTRSGRKKMSCRWLRKLRRAFPDLAEQAERLNQEDDFVMYYDLPEEDRKKKKNKRKS